MIQELAAAFARLGTALDGLEAAVGRHLDVEGRRSELEIELQVMGEDRSRLANELDSATARLARVEATTDHVGLRVGAAIASLRAVLARAPHENRDTAG